MGWQINVRIIIVRSVITLICPLVTPHQLFKQHPSLTPSDVTWKRLLERMVSVISNHSTKKKRAQCTETTRLTRPGTAWCLK